MTPPPEMPPPARRTFFAERYFREQLQALRRRPADCAPWLADALELLLDHVESFPPPGDEDAYVVEYVYPH